MHKVAAFIINYNMPERADAIYQAIVDYVNHPVDVYLVDNGSDIAPQAAYTNVVLERNVQTTRGWLAGLRHAKFSGKDYFAYWFLITSAEYVKEGDILSPMVALLRDDPLAVGVHPALTEDSTTAWAHLKDRGTGRPRRTWMIDNIASLYRAQWFDSVGWFDPDLIYGWGIDLETCYKARQQERSLYVDERVTIKKVTDIGYTMERMNMTASQRRLLAGQNTGIVLSRKYGPDWHNMMTKAHVDERWR